MKHFLWGLFLWLTPPVNAQTNLIQNGSFENHAPTACLTCDLYYGKYPAYVYSWDNLGTGGVLYDTRYKFTEGFDWISGAKNNILPKEGNAMIGLEYTPACGGSWGCMDYVCAKTTETLQVGHLYEITYWLYIQSGLDQDTNWTKHIGMAMLPKKVKNEYRLQVPALTIDTVIYDQWYEVKWKVRPLCTSNYLLIGTFRTDDWPNAPSFYNSFYYIDQVNVHQLPDPDGGVRPDSSVYYCSQYDPQKNPKLRPDMDRIQLYFETGSAELTPDGRMALDSLALFADRYRSLIFEISGHTDSVGTDNEVLSRNRVQSVVNYLQEKYEMPAHRLIQCSFGSTRPLATNQTAAGRALNRRVEIRVSDLTLPQAYYRYALATEQVSEKFKYLHQWQKLASPIDNHVLMLDPRFDRLKKDKRWASLQGQARKAYDSQKYPRKAFIVDSLFIDDELTSGVLTQSLNYHSGYLPAIDSVYFEGLPPYSEAIKMEKAKTRYQNGFKPILKALGWPAASVWGATVQNSAFFLLYHSEDPADMEIWLPVLKTSCEAGETPWSMYAKIYDRCQVLNKKDQRYGTEVQVLGDKTYVRPCEGDRAEVNRLRSRLNMPLIPRAYVLF